MALKESVMIPLGFEAVDFELPDSVSGKVMRLSELSQGKKATLIMFICNHCPYVKHLNSGFVALAQDYADSSLAIIAISSNDVDKYPQDAPDKMKQTAMAEGYTFPYLYDETQEVARAYQAACTPDFYLFDKDLRCRYRGQFDGARPGNNEPITGRDLRQAIDDLLADTMPSEVQTPSAGCSIKWKVQ
ncbi:MAG: thioredoxin family protein [Bernardetiaceae bacterium]|nr:thioredoxin family protein [Bernardetiaceae bacterium]